jgi:hypothetical protein
MFGFGIRSGIPSVFPSQQLFQRLEKLHFSNFSTVKALREKPQLGCEDKYRQGCYLCSSEEADWNEGVEIEVTQ